VPDAAEAEAGVEEGEPELLETESDAAETEAAVGPQLEE
jgi:hypothetical protein